MYDYDACFIFSPQARGIVEAVGEQLSDRAQLRIVSHEWSPKGSITNLEPIWDDLTRAATTVIFFDPVLLSHWYNTQLQGVIRSRVTLGLMRLVTVPLSVIDNDESLPITVEIDYAADQQVGFRTLEGAIVGSIPSTTLYSASYPLVADLRTGVTVSGVFIPLTSFEMRPELNALRTFWINQAHGGVLALVGLGGSGKTALLTRFLQELPDNPLTDSDLSQNSALPSADGLFVWSFYDQPNIEYFFRGLYTLLTGEATTDPARDIVYRLMRVMENLSSGVFLIALDGLEVVQEDVESPGGFGLLRDSSLRHFVRRIARSDLPFKLIVTSRYPLPELQPFEEAGYSVVDTNQLDPESARQLLRTRGTVGTDEELNAVLAEYGTHPLTLDHLGHILHDYFDGQAGAAFDLPAGSFDADKPAQGLMRVLAFYEANLPKDELNVLRVLCVLRKPITFVLLADLFKSPRPEVGDVTPPLNQDDLRRILAQLGHRRLIAFYGADSQTIATVHPSIRDYFHNTFDASVSHIHAETGNHLISLVERPGRTPPANSRMMDFYEAIIYHAAHGDDPSIALEWYERSGGYQRIAWRTGDYQRGLRMTADLMEGLGENFANVRTAPGHEHSLFLLDLGQSLLAERRTLELLGYLHQLAEEIDLNQDRPDFWYDSWHNPFAMPKIRNGFGYSMYEGVLEQTLCDALLMQGKALEARDVMNAVLSVEREWRMMGNIFEGGSGSNPYGRRALARSLLGEVDAAIDDFKAADVFARTYTRFFGIPSANWFHKPFHALLLARLGRLSAARKRLETLDYDHLERFRPLGSAYYDLAAAEIAYRAGQPDIASSHVEKALGWAMQSGQQHVYTQALTMQARLLMQIGQIEAASQPLKEAVDLARSHHFGIQQIDALVLDGHLALSRNDAVQSQIAASEALNLSVNLSYRWGEGDAAHLLAACYDRQKSYATALTCAERAITLRSGLRDPRIAHTRTLIQKIESFPQ